MIVEGVLSQYVILWLIYSNLQNLVFAFHSYFVLNYVGTCAIGLMNSVGVNPSFTLNSRLLYSDPSLVYGVECIPTILSSFMMLSVMSDTILESLVMVIGA